MTGHPAMHRAYAAIEAGFDTFLDDLVMLTEVPAPPFGEAARGEAFKTRIAACGMDTVTVDAVGNVVALRRGTGRGKVAIAAHLDTVFPAGTDVTVRREGTRLYAPGVGDDTRGLAAILAVARALDAADVRTEADLLVVADVGEEGLGDLRGVRHLFEAGEHAGTIDAFFSFDGSDMEKLVTGGIGSLRYRIVFRGPGGHSFIDFGRVNPSNALGAVVAELARTPVPDEPRTTFSSSVLGGGSSINAIPEEVFVEVDLRSADPGPLADLDARLRRLVAQAVEEENGRARLSAGMLTAEIVPIGNRPAAPLRENGRVIDETRAAHLEFGFSPRVTASSTDANVPLALDIPSVTLGSGPGAGGVHTLGEWVDVERDGSVRALKAGLSAVLRVAGIAAG
ncbi:M20/M25/M40 family metallo-hydrolase [Acuticoccus sediminis]|nr:M20/M25/M40 family metallo-hydrolase [Acuticoccus sediminis]